MQRNPVDGEELRSNLDERTKEVQRSGHLPPELGQIPMPELYRDPVLDPETIDTSHSNHTEGDVEYEHAPDFLRLNTPSTPSARGMPSPASSKGPLLHSELDTPTAHSWSLSAPSDIVDAPKPTLAGIYYSSQPRRLVGLRPPGAVPQVQLNGYDHYENNEVAADNSLLRPELHGGSARRGIGATQGFGSDSIIEIQASGIASTMCSQLSKGGGDNILHHKHLNPVRAARYADMNARGLTREQIMLQPTSTQISIDMSMSDGGDGREGEHGTQRQWSAANSSGASAHSSVTLPAPLNIRKEGYF